HVNHGKSCKSCKQLPLVNNPLRIINKPHRSISQCVRTHTLTRPKTHLTKLTQRHQRRVAHCPEQRLLITCTNQPPIPPTLHKLQRCSHPISPNHRQSSRQTFRHNEPPTVIPRRHTQHIRRRILRRQFLPIFKPNKLDSLTHRPQRSHKRLSQLTFTNYLQPHIRHFLRQPHKRRRN